jgi:hypothetical protein
MWGIGGASEPMGFKTTIFLDDRFGLVLKCGKINASSFLVLTPRQNANSYSSFHMS